MAGSSVVGLLAEKIRRLEVGAGVKAQPRFSCGALDALLPGGGLRRGALVDWVAGSAGCGAAALALWAARLAAAEGGLCVVVDPLGDFYPPAAAGWRLDLERLVLARPGSASDLVWTLEQSLRSPGVAAVYARVDRLPDRVCRRLQLSAEASGAVGSFVRPAAVAGQPVWAEVRLLVGARPVTGTDSPTRLLRVERLAGRGRARATCLDVELDDEAGDVRLAARLGTATACAGESGRRGAESARRLHAG